jgi:hypothetical protein
MPTAKRSFFSERQSKFPARTSLGSRCVARTTNTRASQARISPAKSRHLRRRNVIDVFKRIMWAIRPVGIPRRRNLFRRAMAVALPTTMPMRMSSSSSRWTSNGSSKLNRTKNEMIGFKRSNNRFSSVYKTLNRPRPREQRRPARHRSPIRRRFKRSNKFQAIVTVLIVIN